MQRESVADILVTFSQHPAGFVVIHSTNFSTKNIQWQIATKREGQRRITAPRFDKQTFRTCGCRFSDLLSIQINYLFSSLKSETAVPIFSWEKPDISIYRHPLARARYGNAIKINTVYVPLFSQFPKQISSEWWGDLISRGGGNGLTCNRHSVHCRERHRYKQ